MRPRWLPRFFILNLVLFTLPVFIEAISYVLVLVDLAIRPNRINGDPVTYQYQHFSEPGPAWAIVTYFLLPNVVLLAILVWSIAVQRTRSDP